MITLTKRSPASIRIAVHTLADAEDKKKPLAIYLDGDFDEKFVIPMDSRSNLVAYIDESIFIDGRKKYPVSKDAIDAVYKCIHNDIAPSARDSTILHYYNLAVRDLNRKAPLQLIADRGYRFYACPTMRPSQRDSILVSGPSGVGKSCWATDFCLSYRASYATRKIRLISAKPSDDAFDSISCIERIPQERWNDFICKLPQPQADPEEAEEALPGEEEEELRPKRKKRKTTKEEEEGQMKEIGEFSDSLFIFDDIEHISPPAMKKKIYEFKDYLTQVGRSSGIDMILCNHLSMNYHSTRTELNECTAAVIFPQAGSAHHNARYLQTYVGLDKATTKKILDKHYRWVMIYKQHPITVVSETEIWIVR